MKVIIETDFLEKIINKIVELEETPPCERKGIDRLDCFYSLDSECEDEVCDLNCTNGIILANYISTFGKNK